MRSKYMYSLMRAMLNSAICDVGGARLLHITIRLNPLIWYDRLAKRDVFFFFFFELSLHGCCERLALSYVWVENGRNKESYCGLGEWNAGCMQRIELKMCINFAQVYLRNG